MTPDTSKEYQCAVEDAANAFMKVMALRGFAVRDYPQNFVGQMVQQTRLAFVSNRVGAHAHADTLVAELLRAPPQAPRLVSSNKVKPMPFPGLRRRLA